MLRREMLADRRHGLPSSLPQPSLSQDWLILLSYRGLALAFFKNFGWVSIMPCWGALSSNTTPPSPWVRTRSILGQVGREERLGGNGEGSKPQRSHLEKTLAALARPYPVVLAGGIIPTDGAGAFPGRGAPAGWRW